VRSGDEASMPCIETKELTKKFGSLTAVDGLSFAVEEGEVFGLLGPNGAGKTTTVRMLACLISPSHGYAQVHGYDISRNPPKVRQIVGILTENPSLYERLTAYENMDFFAEAYGLSNLQKKQNRITELLEFFELWERRNDRVATFSKGMKQKLAVARALVHKPPVLFLDEPTAGLDPESAKAIRDLVKKLSEREKRTILLCTHRLEDAERLCNRVMILDKGKSVVVGTPEELRDEIAGQPVLQIKLTKVNSKIVKSVKQMKQVRSIVADNAAVKLAIRLDDVKSGTPEVVRTVVMAGGKVRSVKVLRPSLEEAYLKVLRRKQTEAS